MVSLDPVRVWVQPGCSSEPLAALVLRASPNAFVPLEYGPAPRDWSEARDGEASVAQVHYPPGHAAVLTCHGWRWADLAFLELADSDHGCLVQTRGQGVDCPFCRFRGSLR